MCTSPRSSSAGRGAVPAAAVAVLALALAGTAQDEPVKPDQPAVPATESEGPLEGHSHHGAEFNEGPRQRAYLMDGMGNVHFEVTTRSAGPDGSDWSERAAQAQAYFDQGITQLHGFWYLEAERSFRQVAAIDPDCAMAYWGMAMATFDNAAERARGFAWQAWRRREGASPHEQLYIEAIARYFAVDVEPDEKDPTKPADKKLGDEKQRRQKFVEDLEEIVFEHPDDIEAKAFLVNQTWLNTRNGLRISSRQANQALLDQVFAVEPLHPAHHYRIHLWDLKRAAKRVVDSATLCGPSAPGIAHMWHMQGHIWARLDRHAEAAWAQEASARVDHAHMMRDQVLPDQIHNFAHNNEWLTRSLRHVGRVRDAIDLARNMIELPRHPKWNTPQKGGCSASYGRDRLLDVLLMYEQWDALLDACQSGYLEPTGEIADDNRRLGLVGLAHFGKGDVAAGAAQIERLEDLLARAKTARAAAVDAAEEQAIDEGKQDAEVEKAMQAALKEQGKVVAAVRRSIEQLRGLLAFARGGADEKKAAIAALEKANLSGLALSRLCVAAGEHERAVELAKKAREGKDGEAVPIANLAWVLDATGDAAEAAKAFEELRAFSVRFDLDVPPFERLRPIAERLGLPADWRVERALPVELTEKAELARLGPFRWSPPPAAPFELPDGFGSVVSLDQYRGRPVLVIFFLGFGCVHCVEQLGAFRPYAARFEEAGIPIVTIGTDPVAELLESQENDTADERYPFPILADPAQRVFKLYRCYDDFEQMPLHGTFLIDGDARVRWLDVSYEPFTDPEFVLAESKRLLGLTDAAAGSGSGGDGGGGATAQASR